MPDYHFEVYRVKDDGAEDSQMGGFFDAPDDEAAKRLAARRLASNRSTLFKMTHQRLSRGDFVVFNEPI
jgi:hypothetical protein